MYVTVYGKDEIRNGKNVILLQNSLVKGPFNTVEEAEKARAVTGDLVFDAETKEIVKSGWLWEHDEYARRCIENNVTLHGELTINTIHTVTVS